MVSAQIKVPKFSCWRSKFGQRPQFIRFDEGGASRIGEHPA
jgi:hypothetical protein